MSSEKTFLLGLNIVNAMVKFVAADLCYDALSLIYENGMYPQETTGVNLEMACAATGSISILLGLEYLIFRSKEKRGIRSGLVFVRDILISAILIYILFSTSKEFKKVYLGDKKMDSEADSSAYKVRQSFKFAYDMSHAAGIVLIASIFYLLPLVYFNETD